jgi:hypothetical protein
VDLNHAGIQNGAPNRVGCRDDDLHRSARRRMCGRQPSLEAPDEQERGGGGRDREAREHLRCERPSPSEVHGADVRSASCPEP